MKIAVNTRLLLDNKLEGIGWHTYEILRRMAAAHPEDSFYFLFDRPYHPQFIFGPNVHPLVLPPPARHPLLFYIWFEWSVYRALRRIKPDVFYSTDGFLSLRTSIPTLLTVHDLAYHHFPEHLPWVMRTYYQQMMPRFVRRANHLITVSAFSKKDLIARFNVLPEKITVAYNGLRPVFHSVDASEKQTVRDEVSAGQPYFLYVGSMHPRKNIERFLEAFSRFKDQDSQKIHLVLAGRMAWKASSIKSKLDIHSYRDYIHLTGMIPDEQMARLYRGAIALVYPSLFEGFGMPALEALASHTIPVLSGTSSLPEVGGEVAIYVDPLQTSSILNGMLQALNHDAHDAGWVKKADEQVNKFSWDESATLIYQELLNLSGR